VRLAPDDGLGQVRAMPRRSPLLRHRSSQPDHKNRCPRRPGSRQACGPPPVNGNQGPDGTLRGHAQAYLGQTPPPGTRRWESRVASKTSIPSTRGPRPRAGLVRHVRNEILVHQPVSRAPPEPCYPAAIRSTSNVCCRVRKLLCLEFHSIHTRSSHTRSSVCRSSQGGAGGLPPVLVRYPRPKGKLNAVRDLRNFRESFQKT
jgi:hypothetical protein